ncbi:FecCD family ABC transporter permease [Bifidobacterium sp.]|uniref:FecCD family ABC transporter permease n=1 Tax=Bifidobacterium sp. TaxID=41200 RepID=UPI0025BD2D12|nr:iron chelate uptake ABC transporter family permease subunit [Bifidobacterium sp.]MCI1634744.1 iron chelate uptake ABC transporter family permease subunit [Bifidobacterium sp.]
MAHPIGTRAITYLTPSVQVRMHRRRRTVVVCCILGALGLALLYLDITYGTVMYSFDQLLRVISGEQLPGVSFALGELRIPRSLTALICGATFGLAGSCFQHLLRNPLASPDIIGITSGANTAAVFGIVVLGLSGIELSALAIAGGLITAAVVSGLTWQGRLSLGRLILIGIAFGAMLDAVSSWMLVHADQWDIQSASRWLTGSLSGTQWSDVLLSGCALLLGGVALMPLSRRLNILRLGDDLAAGLGVRVGLSQIAIVIVAVAMLSVATAAVGPIAFVSFLSGPIARRISGYANSALMESALVGACLVLGSDILAQHVAAEQMPVGVITSVVGGPVLVLLMTISAKKGNLE